MMTSADIRKEFLNFFAIRGHQVVPSAPIVIKNDPTLLFTNAGMNQFKDCFLGNKKPASARITDTQKCLRVSGKHNDLEEVGVDTYHHTMFEMLGNWSFGDYFKTEAIAWSWELLTEVYKLDKDRLYVTIFEGDAKEGLPKDEEACQEWKKVIAEDRILLGNKKDNFWEMGDTGPCGPCSEIHVDCRSEAERKQVDGKTLVNKDHPQVIEIWNNVFMQFNRLKDGSLQPLPAQHVDTGMGFERLVRVIQGKQSNYDTDVFSTTINYLANKTPQNIKYGDFEDCDIAFRVIADHIRAITFTIADGQLPSNTGAGYVIRRILRRAVRYGYDKLQFQKPFLAELVPLLASQFKDVFPEVEKQKEFIQKVITEEEVSFFKTLGAGKNLFWQYTEGHIFKNGGLSSEIFPLYERKIVQGKFAFDLYDTYGFPLDLTQLLAKENGFTVDIEGFDKAMLEQKTRSRAAGVVDAEDWIVLIEDGINEFVGYDSLEIRSKLVKYRKVTARGKEAYQLVLQATPFYAESGGQAGDTGVLDFDGESIVVTDTKKENNLIIHFTDILPAHIGSAVMAKVDLQKRKATAVHHSATHLLHAALRKVLGAHVAQKGSLVNEEQLRFDFSHFAKLTEEEIAQIESMVNEKIRANIPVYTKEMSKDEAVAMGAMALFGEKYGDIVRVVIIDPQYSIELCGGTHVGATGELGFFRIKHESAVAAGVRRIEAVSGHAAENLVSEAFAQLRSIREALKNPKDPAKAVETLQADTNELKKRMESLEAKQLIALRNELAQKTETINGIEFLGAIVELSSADALKKLCFEMKSVLSRYVVVLAANIEGKAQVAVLLDEAVSSERKLEAPNIIKEQIATLIKGGGGGQKTLATAGGQDAGNLRQVIEKVRSLLT